MVCCKCSCHFVITFGCIAFGQHARTHSKTQAPPADTQGEDVARQSRSLISSMVAVPEALLSRYPPPANTVIHHTVHKDSTLPHFQGRVLGGQVFEGKCLAKQYSIFKLVSEFCKVGSRNNKNTYLRQSASASYNQEVAEDAFHEKYSTIGSLPARKRCMTQAYFMVWSWLKRATETPAAKRRRVS